MPRAVIEVLAMGANAELYVVVEEAFGAPVDRVGAQLASRPSDAIFALASSTAKDRVKQAGSRLYQDLSASTDVQKAFNMMSKTPVPGELPPEYPIFVKLAINKVERFPWEALYGSPLNDFLTLAKACRWPIARMAAAPRPHQSIVRNLDDRFRIAVIIAAANYDGREEWNQIATALRKLELPVSILALVSDAALKKEMEKTTWDGNVQLKAQFTGDKDLLLKELGAFSPNIVHFFCHGTADPDPLLLVETRNIRLGATDDVPITLSSGDLEPIVQSSWFWLAVLNCCQGSKASAQLPSLARELVQKGAPTVIAMRESVAVADAQLFTEEFYPALVDQLNSLFKVATLVPEEEKVPVEELVWIRPLHAARWRLATTPSTRQPASAIEWTYPVIYVNRDELCLRRGSPVPALADDERRSLQDQLRIERNTRDAINRGGGGPGSTTKLDEHIAILEKRLGL